MFLRDIAVHADESIVSTYKDGFVGKFSRDASCCVSLFLSLISRKIETKGTVKLLLIFTNDKKSLKKKHHMYPEQPDVLTFPWLFPFDKYVESSDIEKKHLIFSAMCDCVKYLAKQYQWNTKPIDDAQKEAQAQNYQFEGYLKYSWVSPNAKHRIRVYYDYGIKFLELYGCLFKNRSKIELGRKFLGRVVPVQGCVLFSKSSGKWLSNNKFVLDEPSFWNSKWELSIDEMIEENSL